MGLVVDASVAACWMFKNEATPDTDALFVRVRDAGGVVPALWIWDVANLLAIGIRRRRLTAAEATAHLADLAQLPIVTDAEATARAWREAFGLANAHKLTAYDAAYLELAQRTGLDLASKDVDLRAAAAAIGVKVVP